MEIWFYLESANLYKYGIFHISDRCAKLGGEYVEKESQWIAFAIDLYNSMRFQMIDIYLNSIKILYILGYVMGNC